MLFEKISVLTEDFCVRENLFVGVKGDIIDYIGSERPAKDYGETYSGKEKLLMPGLVNAHSHAPMTLLRGYAEGYSLQDWLQKRVFPFEAKMTGEDIYFASMLAYAEMLRFGVTSAADMYFFGEDMARAVLDSGIRANICLSVTCFDDREFSALPVYAETNRLLERHQRDANGRLNIDACLHAEYSSTPKVVSGVGKFARDNGLRVHMHLSETKAEHDACKKKYGLTPAGYLERQGLFETCGIAAHCVFAERADREILAKNNISAVSNPISNLKLASGIMDAPAMLASGVNLALGTDGAASNNNLNLFEEMKALTLVSRALKNDPSAISAAEALYAATRGGAIALGRKDCGLVKEGFKADLIVLDISGPWMLSLFDWASQLCYSAQGSDVVLAMVDGKILFRDGQWPAIDIREVKSQVQKRAMRIAGDV